MKYLLYKIEQFEVILCTSVLIHVIKTKQLTAGLVENVQSSKWKGVREIAFLQILDQKLTHWPFLLDPTHVYSF